jgi:hypothetical protein
MASNRPGFYRSEVGYPSPTSSQNLASKRAQYLPKMGQNPQKIHFLGIISVKNPLCNVKKPHFSQITE